MDLLTQSLQLLISAVLGGIVGLDRERRHKAAGYRTLSLVSMGVTLFTQLSIHGFGEGDPTRVAAQIITGIGFLGAGVIIFHQDKVRNLTTAATVWVVAAIGMAVGVGWYWEAVVAAALTLIILRVLLIRGQE